MTDEGDLVGQMMAAMRSNDPDVVLELYADDCQVADPAMQLSGKEGLRTAVDISSLLSTCGSSRSKK